MPTAEELAYLGERIADVCRLAFGLPDRFEVTTWCEQTRVSLVNCRDDFYGRYRRDPAPTIYLNLWLSRDRRNFTAGHELGHHLIEECRSDSRVRARLDPYSLKLLGLLIPASNEEEIVCNAISGALLLPPPVIETWLEAGNLGLASLQLLAARQQMSLSATIIRLRSASNFRGLFAIGKIAADRKLHVNRVYGGPWRVPKLATVWPTGRSQPARDGATRRWLYWVAATRASRRFQVLAECQRTSNDRIVLLVHDALAVTDSGTTTRAWRAGKTEDEAELSADRRPS